MVNLDFKNQNWNPVNLVASLTEKETHVKVLTSDLSQWNTDEKNFITTLIILVIDYIVGKLQHHLFVDD